MLKTAFIDKVIHYSGTELRPHYILSQLRIQGSAVVAFSGSCHVQTEDLVDWEDRLVNDQIFAREMLHFLGEFFGPTLREAVFFQRLFVAIISEVLREIYSVNTIRNGDDLWVGNRKLSVSIVTSCSVSQLLHLGINIDPEGAPVPAVGLRELGVPTEGFAREVLRRFESEFCSVGEACTKVRPLM